MGLTGNWDGRISRRTLLRTGGSAAAGLVLLGSRRPRPGRYRRSGAIRSASASPQATRPTTGSCCGRGSRPLRSRAAACRPRCSACATSWPPTRTSAHRAPRLDRGAAGRGAHRARRDRGPPARDRVLVPVQVGHFGEPDGKTRTAPAPDATPIRELRLRLLPELHLGPLQRLRESRSRTSTWSSTSGTTSTRAPVSTPRVRDHFPQRELLSLDDYRTRHAQYRTDPDLREAHGSYPFLMTWDDHEFKDNYADLQYDPEVPLETAAARRAAAYLAYWEHAPLSRARKPVGKDMPLFRRARWGSLATFHVLDTRQHRSDQFDPVRVSARIRPATAQTRCWTRAGSSAPRSASGCSTASGVGYELERPREPGPVRAARSQREPHRQAVHPGQVGRLRRRPRGRARHARRSRAGKHDRDHRRLAHHSVRNVPPTSRASTATPWRRSSSARRSAADGDPVTVRPGSASPTTRTSFSTTTSAGTSASTSIRTSGRASFRSCRRSAHELPATTLATFVVENGKPGAQIPSGVVSAV